MKKLSFVLLSLMTTSLLQAQMIVTTSTSNAAPDKDNYVWSWEPTANLSNFNWNGPGTTPPQSVRDLGISFKASSNTSFDAFTLKIANFTAATLGANFELRIFETDAFNTDPSTGVLKMTLSGLLPATFAVGDFLTFQLPESLSVTNGKFYSFLLHYTAETGSQQIGFVVNTGGGTNDSQLWSSTNPDTDWTRNGGTKMLMYVYTVPEPSSVALIALAGVLFWIRRNYFSNRKKSA